EAHWKYSENPVKLGFGGTGTEKPALPADVPALLMASALTSRLHVAPSPNGCRLNGSGPSDHTVRLKPMARNARLGAGGRLLAASWKVVPICGRLEAARDGTPALPTQPEPYAAAVASTDVSLKTIRLRMQPLKARPLLKSLVVMFLLLPSLNGPTVA